MKYNRPEFIPDQVRLTLGQYLEHRTETLATTIADKLMLPDAKLILPRDLASASTTVFAPDEIQAVYPNVNAMVRFYQRSLPGSYFTKRGIQRHEFARRYLDLIGRDGQVGQGNLADALRRTSQSMSTDAAEEFERQLANHYLMMRGLDQSFNIPPQVYMPDSQHILLDTAKKIVIPIGFKPEAVLEYGPGLASISKVRGGEIEDRQHTMMIENRIFTSQALIAAAGSAGIPIDSGQFVSRHRGIGIETTDLLKNGLAESYDLIIASSLQGADFSEVQIGIANGYRLLKPGGLYIARAANEAPSENQMPGIQIMMNLSMVFNGGFRFSAPIIGEKVVTGEKNKGIVAVYQKI